MSEYMAGLTEIEQGLVRQAINEHREIYPCADKLSFQNCFTHDRNLCFFWYNTPDQSTHVAIAAAAAS